MRIVLVALLMVPAACDSSTEPEPELSIQLVSGDNQVGGYGGPLPQSVSVRVTDAAGQPVAGQQVVWRVVAGGGRTDSTTTTTNQAGIAVVNWTLGMDEGTQLLSVSAGNASMAVRATAAFRFASVTVGFRHTCVLSSAGEAFCWGNNNSGQLGDGTETARTEPTRVLTNKRFLKLSAGWSHTCGLTVAGEVFCWGDNQAGQLGIGSTTPRSHAPTTVSATTAFQDVAAGFVHSCAVSAGGDVFCWGSNGHGQLGSADPATARSARQVNSTVKFTSVATGEFHSCGVATTREAYCWGWNSTGELGAGIPFGEDRNAPLKVSTITNVTAIAAGVRHTCAIATSLYCWGRNATGETGQPPLSHANTPALAANTTGLLFVGAGDLISCAASATTAYCMGSDGFRTNIAPEARFTGAITSLGVGYNEICVVSAGDAYCWGAMNRDPVKIVRPR